MTQQIDLGGSLKLGPEEKSAIRITPDDWQYVINNETNDVDPVEVTSDELIQITQSVETVMGRWWFKRVSSLFPKISSAFLLSIRSMYNFFYSIFSVLFKSIGTTVTHLSLVAAITYASTWIFDIVTPFYHIIMMVGRLFMVETGRWTGDVETIIQDPTVQNSVQLLTERYGGGMGAKLTWYYLEQASKSADSFVALLNTLYVSLLEALGGLHTTQVVVAALIGSIFSAVMILKLGPKIKAYWKNNPDTPLI